MKILNLYCGIGGNRKLWGGEHDITAVELNPKIAKIYKDFFPNDNVIVGDAHDYLLKNFKKFDFIWASPPCPTHGKLQLCQYFQGRKMNYPDMKIYQEIILLKHCYTGNWIIENVKPYYKALIEPSFVIQRHFFWSNKFILTNDLNLGMFSEIKDKNKSMEEKYKFDLSLYKSFGYKFIQKVLRNCVIPELGKYVFEKINGEIIYDNDNNNKR